MSEKRFLAFDFGASNGRAIIGKYDGKKIVLQEIHRFENRPVFTNGVFFWDILRLYSELKIGIKKALLINNKEISTIGIDTWGVDFGLLDKDKNLISNPIHYRDKSVELTYKKVFKILSEREIYYRTGVQFMKINTIFKLYSMVINKSVALKNAKYFLMMGDLLNFFLTGEIFSEYTNTTTSQIYNLEIKNWDYYILEKLKINKEIFQNIVEPGKIIGNIKKEVMDELSCKSMKVSLPAYDTSSEVASIPFVNQRRDTNWAFLCCGTSAIIGIESKTPIIKESGLKYGWGNEGGVEGKYNYLKNITGMWIIQKCREKWLKESKEKLGWEEIKDLALAADDNKIFIDVDDKLFEIELFDMPYAIINYCKKTGQNIPKSIGEIARCFYESFVLKYLINLRNLEKIIGKKIEFIHLVGGGSKNELLCQWLADALGLPVISGPAETTTIGNILLQMMAKKDINNIEEGRQLVKNSIKLNYYTPKNNGWDQKFEIYLNLIKKKED